MIRYLSRLAALTLAAYSGWLAGRLTARPDADLIAENQRLRFQVEHAPQWQRAMKEKTWPST